MLDDAREEAGRLREILAKPYRGEEEDSRKKISKAKDQLKKILAEIEKYEQEGGE